MSSLQGMNDKLKEKEDKDMEPDRKIDLFGFLFETISVVDRALQDSKESIIQVDSMDTYVTATQKLLYATGIVDTIRGLINYMEDETSKKIMSIVEHEWDSKLQYLEKFLEEQKPAKIEAIKEKKHEDCIAAKRD